MIKKITQNSIKTIVCSCIMVFTFLFSLTINSQDLALQGVGDINVGGAGFGGNDGKFIHLVATADIADNAITTAKIPDGAITAAKINSGVTLGGAYFQGENGAVGAAAGKGDIFRVHEKELNTNVTIAATDNALASGPLTVASGVTLTIANGGRLAIV